LFFFSTYDTQTPFIILNNMRQHRFILSYRTSNQWEHLHNKGFDTKKDALNQAYALILYKGKSNSIGDLTLDGVSLNLPAIERELRELA